MNKFSLDSPHVGFRRFTSQTDYVKNVNAKGLPAIQTLFCWHTIHSETSIMQFPMQNVAIFVPNLVPKFNYSLYSFEMEFHLENGSKRIIRISNSLNFNSESTAIWAASWQKTTKWQVCPAKTQISLGTRPVWSVFAVRMMKPWVLSYPLSAQRRLWSDWAHSHFVCFVMRRLIYVL